jgi:pSer/pThr/pTyr-binding forkhead associated (FHA) protein
MSPFVLSVLKYALLALLYFFVYRAVKSVAVDLSGRRPAPAGPRGDAKTSAAPRGSKGRAPTSLVVHAPDARKPQTFRLSGALEIGRADSCQVRLEDTYASQHHARLSARDGSWFLEDLGSTNGTYLNDRRVQASQQVRSGDVVRIGKTVLELRR